MIVGSVRLRGDRDPVAERERALREIREPGLGGVVIFGGESAEVRSLSDELLGASDVPLIIAADLERGAGQQFGGATALPSAMAVGATGDPGLARAAGRLTAVEARSAGVNTVLAPVADLATDLSNPIVGTRSFGSRPDTVAEFVAGFVLGCQEGGAAATVKHFPGHGATAADSHIELPSVGERRATLESRELVPFEAAVRAGVRAVMTAHVAYASLDPGVPASLSRAVSSDLLRDVLGFDGLVMTDALAMGGVADAQDPAAAAVLAGADVLLMPEDAGGAVGSVCAAVRAGTISEVRIADSLDRLDAFHRWVEERPAPRVGRSDAAVVGEIATAAVTLVRGERSATGPPPGSSRLRCVVLTETARPVDLSPLREELASLAPDVAPTVVSVTDRSAAGARADAATPARSLIFVVDEVAAWRGFAGLSDTGRALLDGLVRSHTGSGSSATVVALGTPIAPTTIPEECGLLWAYDASPASQKAALRAALGRAGATGRSPVDLPG